MRNAPGRRGISRPGRFAPGQRDGCGGTIAGEQGAERGVLVAEPGLGQLSLAGHRLLRARLFRTVPGGQMIAQVPDRMRERCLLPDEEQAYPDQLEPTACHITIPVPSGTAGA